MRKGKYTPLSASLAWIACNLIGWFAAGLLAWVFGRPEFPIKGPAMLLVVVLLPALGQWLMLRPLLRLSPLWLATIPLASLLFAGLAVTLSAAPEVLGDDEGIGVISALYAIFGALIGAAQWVLLRRHFGRAGIWIPACAAGAGIGLLIVLSTGLMNASGLAAYAVVVLSYAALSGAALGWLLAHEDRREGLRAP